MGGGGPREAGHVSGAGCQPFSGAVGQGEMPLVCVCGMHSLSNILCRPLLRLCPPQRANQGGQPLRGAFMFQGSAEQCKRCPSMAISCHCFVFLFLIVTVPTFGSFFLSDVRRVFSDTFEDAPTWARCLLLCCNVLRRVFMLPWLEAGGHLG